VAAFGKRSKATKRPEQPKLHRVGPHGNALRAAGLPQTNGPTPTTTSPTTAEESKKQRRERENASVPGGMRTPWKYVKYHPRARIVGSMIADVIDRFLDQNPDVSTWLLEEGEEGREKYRAIEMNLLKQLGYLLGAKSLDFGKSSKWRADLVEAYVRVAEDPEVHFADWLRNGAPTGVAREIVSCGIFPQWRTMPGRTRR